jgi:tetratricopeptide (TPR) repeat protein
MSRYDYRESRIDNQIIVERGTVQLRANELRSFPVCPEPYIPHVYTLSSGKFVGRERELYLLDQWAKRGSESVFAIIGLGGSGKSALAWHWFHAEVDRKQRGFDGFLWWSFYEEDAGYSNFLVHALAYLCGEQPSAVAERSVDENCRSLVSILNARRVLICMDGHERITNGYRSFDLEHAAGDVHAHSSAADTEIDALFAGHTPDVLRAARYRHALGKAGVFLRQICGIRKSRILITSRLRPAEFETAEGQLSAGVNQYDEMSLSDQDAVALLRGLEITGSKTRHLRIANAVGNHALTLRVLAGDVRKDRRAGGDLDVWMNRHPGFDPTALNIVQRKTHVLHTALLGLNGKDLTTLAAVAAFRGPAGYDHLSRILVEQGAVFANEDEIDETFDELEQRYLIGWNRPVRSFDMHPIIRAIVWRRLGEFGRREIARFHSDYFGQAAAEGMAKSPQQFYSFHQLFFSLIELKRYDEAFDLLASRVLADLVESGRSYEVVEMLEAILEEGDPGRMRLTNPTKRADCLYYLSLAYPLAGRYLESVRCDAEMAGHLRNLNDNDRASNRDWLGRRAAITLIRLGRVRDARALWEIAETSLPPRFRTMQSDEVLGHLFFATGRIGDAIQHLRRFIADYAGNPLHSYPLLLAVAALTLTDALDNAPHLAQDDREAYTTINFAMSIASKYGLAELKVRSEIVKVDFEARRRGDRPSALPRLRRLVESARVRRFITAEVDGLSRILDIFSTGNHAAFAENAAEQLEQLDPLHDMQLVKAHTRLRLARFYLATSHEDSAVRAAQSAFRAACEADGFLAFPSVADEAVGILSKLGETPDSRVDPAEALRSTALDEIVTTLKSAYQS